MTTSVYVPPPGSSDSVGLTAQQPGRQLDFPERLSVAVDTVGTPNDVGIGAADKVAP